MGRPEGGVVKDRRVYAAQQAEAAAAGAEGAAAGGPAAGATAGEPAEDEPIDADFEVKT